MIGARELTAFSLMPLVLGAIVLLPPWVYLAMVWFVTMMAAWELLALLRRHQFPVPLVPSLVVLGATLPGVWVLGLPWAHALLLVPLLGLPLIYLLGRYPIAGASAAISGAIFTCLFFTATGGAMGLLRTVFPGSLGIKMVLLHCLTVWGGDSGAYYIGVRFGRHKMAPRVSPKKSWEGLVGGTALTFFGVWFCRTVFMPELPWALGAALAALLSVVTPLGDLVESLFKRDVGVKDSSDLIPGHGGFLDRSDSIYFAAPFTLALLLLGMPS
jgi:phosphatidate cytidylyltransferase